MVIKGRGVSEGIAIGKITLYSKKKSSVASHAFTSVMKETSRFRLARTRVRAKFAEMQDEFEVSGDKTQSELMASYIMILDDPECIAETYTQIKTNHKTAEEAVIVVRNNMRDSFLKTGDPYIQARADDVMDIAKQLIVALSGNTDKGPALNEPTIVIADRLSPSELLALDKSKCMGLITKKGSYLSHTAILSRLMGIPYITGIDYPAGCNGQIAIINTFDSEAIINPGENTLIEYRKRLHQWERDKSSLISLKDLPSETADGKHIGLYANVGSIADIKSAVEAGAEGVGLLRTEFLYIDSAAAPSEKEQYKAYAEAVDILEGRPLTIRTFDVGGDKMPSYLDVPEEANPALGTRAIRYCLGHQDMFRTQLRAILRAAAKGPVSILFPMIISIEEIQQIKSIIGDIKADFNAKGIEYGDCQLGIMIETPAAAIIADLLAREVDFFSIGTNDLTQYTLAVDRMNASLDFICDYHHEAVLRLMRSIISSGHDGGCRVALCGELASAPDFTKELLRMGVDELSIVPSRLMNVKKEIREMRFS